MKILFFFLLFTVISCTKSKNIISTPVSETPVNEVSDNIDSQKEEGFDQEKKKPGECKTLGMSGDQALAVWKMKNATDFVVCNLSDYHMFNENKFRGWVNLFPRPVSLDSKMIPEVDGEMPSAHLTFVIEKLSDEKISIRRDIKSVYTDGEESNDIPVTLSYIDCSKKECVTSKQKCIYEKPKGEVDLKVVEYAQRIVDGKTKDLKEQGHYDVVINKLVDAALKGNKQAMKLILGEDGRRKLEVDGASGEAFKDGYNILTGLVELGCIKR